MDLKEILPAIGYLGIFSIVFAESGLFIGFFLPGDSLLFTAGFLASQGIFDIKILALGAFIFAVLGDSVGYEFGKKVGRKLFKRPDSFLFKKENLEKAENFYEKHGKKTIILARFIPIIRTFAPIIAGIGDMHYKTFLSYNVFGGFFWAVGISFAGFWLGNTIPNVDRYLLPIVLGIIIASVAPGFYHILKDKKQRKQLFLFVKDMVSKIVNFTRRG
ncbi:MAG: VTT domain-containing protein [Patescibacteria group bacterium]|nr:VTT domain-containing protein [Patescibacteria group bacterium]